jgi:hypothetical protein
MMGKKSSAATMMGTRVKELVAQEVDGCLAKKHVREIINYHRSIGGSEYHEAAEYLKRYLRSVGLQVTSIDAPLDNLTRAGNYTLPYAWEPYCAILKVVEPEKKTLVTFHETPTCINSWSAATPPGGVIAELVYVGEGTSDEDYEGKDIAGKIVFVDRGYTWRTHALAVEKYGAIGFINDDIREIPYYKTREMYPDFVLWNTLYERQRDGGQLQGWGLSISPRMGDYLRDLLQRGPVKLHAQVGARTFVGVMENPMGAIEGSKYPQEEVLLVAHLCHTRPGAVDNSAGCAHITEVARIIQTLIEREDIPRPKRSIKFLYDPEGHGSNVYFESIESHLERVIVGIGSHCGGDPEKLKGTFRLGKSMTAVPSFLPDLCIDILEKVSEQFPVPGPKASNPFAFVVQHSSMMQVASGWGIPSVEMGRTLNANWHTPYDTLDKVSSEELTKTSWVAAIVALTVADAGLIETVEIMRNVEARSEERLNQACRLARQELTEAAAGEALGILEARLDQLSYLQERDSRAIASSLILVRNEDEDTQAIAQGECSKLVETLAKKAKQEEVGLREFAEFLHGELAPLEDAPDPAYACWKPKMIGPGWIEMKRLTVELGEKYESMFASTPGVMARRGFLEPMYEVCHLSHGERTIKEIARIVHHELGPIEIGTVKEIVEDIEALGFMTVIREEG